MYTTLKYSYLIPFELLTQFKLRTLVPSKFTSYKLPKRTYQHPRPRRVVNAKTRSFSASSSVLASSGHERILALFPRLPCGKFGVVGRGSGTPPFYDFPMRRGWDMRTVGWKDVIVDSTTVASGDLGYCNMSYVDAGMPWT